jgi:ketosteroid isomerase-like protein
MPDESTPPDLVEVLRRFTESLERRDFDEALSFFAPEPVWDMSAMGTGTFEGPAAIRGLLEDWVAPYDEWEIEVEEWLDLGYGVVLAVLMESGRPTGSTGRVQLRYASVGVWAHDTISRVATYADIREARAAAERLAEERG